MVDGRAVCMKKRVNRLFGKISSDFLAKVVKLRSKTSHLKIVLLHYRQARYNT